VFGVAGEVGLVYPLARGTPILLTAVGLQVVRVDDPLSPLAIVGIVVVICGITLLCTEAIFKSNKPTNKVEENIITINPLTKNRTNGVVSNLDVEDSGGNVEIATLNTIRNRDSIVTVDPGTNDVLPTDEEVHPHTDRKKILTSIALALAVGVSSASYSTIDALAVRKMNPVVFLCLMNILSTTSLFPFLYKYHYDKTIIALTVHWKTILLISPCVVCSYLIILMVFSIFKVSVALVVAVRTSSVLLGSFIGVVFLGERYSIIKFTSILVMCVGIVIIKFG
jgi:drug/metabolite transporter (DMT)-like permease